MENINIEKLQYPIGKYIAPDVFTDEYISKCIAEIASFPELKKEDCSFKC